jgi:hypothetical protein
MRSQPLNERYRDVALIIRVHCANGSVLVLAGKGKSAFHGVFLQVTLWADWYRRGPNFPAWACREKRGSQVQHTRAASRTFEARRVLGYRVEDLVQGGKDISGHGSQPTPKRKTRSVQ